MYRAAQTTIPREVDEPWITGLAIGHIARIVAGEFTNYKRTTFKARFECLGESFQLLDGHESSDSDLCIRRGNVRLLSMPVARPQSRRSRARGGGGQFERACTLSFGGKATLTFFSLPKRWEST